MKRIIFSFVVAFIFTVVFTPLIRKLALKIGAVDKPNDRKIHLEPIPRLGGLAIYLSFITTILINYNRLDNHIKGLLVGSAIIVLCGIIDDIKELNYRMKLIFQLIAALSLISNNICIDKLTIITSNGLTYLNLGAWSIPITIIWVIAITNAINLIDGLDGLACGLSTISFLFLTIISLSLGNVHMAIILAILIGACAGFLPYNFNPAKIFLGDTGSLFLGFILASMSIQGTMKYATTVIMIIPLFVLGLPIYDTINITIRRLLKGQPITTPDKEHFHHRMLALGLSQKQVAILAYFVNILLGLLAISIIFIDNRDIIVIIVVGTLLIIFAILDNLFYLKKKRKG